IRPRSYDIAPVVSGDTLRFTLDCPRNLSVEVNGDIFHNLHLFANPIDKHRPSENEIRSAMKGKNPKLLYYGPGVHRLPGDTLRVPSGTTVYVDGGARVYGRFIADGVNDVRFYGRGEIHPEGRGEGIYIKRSRNVDAEGVIVTQIPVGQSDSVNIDNVKSISYYGWGDGMNVFASNNVHYNGVFCRNSDDCSTVYATRKGFVGGCDNILMENSTLWADVAHPIMIGLHGSAKEIGPDAPADTICNVTYRNIDILDHQEAQIDYQGCFGISCGDNNIVRDIVFDNIRVEDFRQGQLVNIRIFFNKKYCAAPGGEVSNVLFKDITYNGNNSEVSIIAGYDDERTVNNITFDNLVINGKHIYDDMPGKPKWYKTGDFARIFIGEHVNGVEFR
ncbi:MAG: endo-polygalacturonase, partial [Muribaculaceae bacterium]|nr:endo-polygalacturonase [Muribaculaceae bacterium]